MKSNHKVLQHFPLLSPQLIVETKVKNEIDSKSLKLFIDTDEDDENRTVMSIFVQYPHIYDFSLSFEGFENFTNFLDNEKHITGKVFLVCKVNQLSKRLALKTDVQDKKIELASPKLRVFPIKAATQKNQAVWASPEDISRQIKSNWLDAFSSALNGYLVQSYNLINAESITNALEANKEQSKLFTSSENLGVNESNERLSQKNTILGNLNGKQKKIVYAIGGYTFLLSFIVIAALVKSVFFSTPQPNQPQLANSNFQIPTNIMSVEEAKKAQLRELGINPDDLAADLGCFVEEN